MRLSTLLKLSAIGLAGCSTANAEQAKPAQPPPSMSLCCELQMKEEGRHRDAEMKQREARVAEAKKQVEEVKKDAAAHHREVLGYVTAPTERAEHDRTDCEAKLKLAASELTATRSNLKEMKARQTAAAPPAPDPDTEGDNTCTEREPVCRVYRISVK